MTSQAELTRHLSALHWLLLSLLFSAAASAAVLEVQPGPFRSGRAYLPCNFDGVKETCFLDTGSAITVLANSEQFSAYPNSGGFRFKSASGIAEELETIQIRIAAVDRVIFSNIKIGRAKEDHSLESALGIDLLRRQPFSINFHDSPALFLNPKPPRQLLSGLEANAHGLLSLPLAFGTNLTRAMLDTGASLTAVDAAFVKAHPEDFKSSGDLMKGTDGFGHEIQVHLFRARKIHIGARTFRNVKIVALDLSMLGRDANSQVHAVIGFNLIRRTDWYFDTQRRLWSIR